MGEVTAPFAQAYPDCEVEAFDAAEKMIDQARLKLSPQLASRVRYVNCSLPRDVDRLGQYDVIISNSLLHHLPDPQILWQTIRRCAKPGAAFLVMDLIRPPSVGDARRLIEAYADGLPRLVTTDFYCSLLAAYRLDEVRRQLEEAELEDCTVTAVNELQLMVHGRVSSGGSRRQ